MTTSLFRRAALSSALAAAALAPATHAADIPLYPTGPAEDASYVRFVNAGEAAATLQAAGSQASLALTPAKPASDFLPVAAGKPVVGTLQRGDARVPVSVTVAAGEFATVVGLTDAAGKLSTAVLRERPEDFNALRAALGFYNVDPGCAGAGLRAAGRDVPIFADVPAAQVRRRMVNPVALSVQLVCGGQPQGAPLALGTLAAGERYTVFAVPAGTGTRVFAVTDAVAR